MTKIVAISLTNYDNTSDQSLVDVDITATLVASYSLIYVGIITIPLTKIN